VIFFAAPRTSELLFGRDTRAGRIRYPHSLQSPASDDAAVVDPVCHFAFEICPLQLSFFDFDDAPNGKIGAQPRPSRMYGQIKLIGRGGTRTAESSRSNPLL